MKIFFTLDWRNFEGFRTIIAGGFGLAFKAEKWIRRCTPASRANLAIVRGIFACTSSNEKLLFKKLIPKEIEDNKEFPTEFHLYDQLN